jgi:hypothetical protein
MMETRAFTLAAQAAGLSLRTVSRGAVSILEAMADRPLELRDPRAISAPTAARNMLGPLIRHGLACFDREAEAYRITDKGRDYLAKLEAAGLICKPVAESPAFANWWYEEGSGIGPEQFPGRDLCEFVRAVAAIAWANGEYVGRLNKEGGAA